MVFALLLECVQDVPFEVKISEQNKPPKIPVAGENGKTMISNVWKYNSDTMDCGI